MANEFKNVLQSLHGLYKSVLSLEEGTDYVSTIDGIRKDISFRGATAWVLIFSIFIASIGLNVNSTAVIIGAMLISPLMGPIVGMGLGVGINDFGMIAKSLKNIGIAVAISLLSSTLYFLITPLDIEQTELIARTKPTILDVLVALFGGFAGIIAASRKEKNNVIPGVAIATALMPPLCTAGYGLATFKLTYFFGAFYLFFINSVFISLSTFIVVRYLKFPLVDYVDQARLKKNKIILALVLAITIIPSSVIFYTVIQETRFKVAVDSFVKAKCSFDGSELVTYKSTFNDTMSVINLYYIGAEIDENKQFYLNDHLGSYGLKGGGMFDFTDNTKVIIHQEGNSMASIDKQLNEFNNKLRINILEDLYKKNDELIQSKDEKIQFLENELIKYKSKNDPVAYAQIARELIYHFPNIEKYSFAQSVEVSTENQQSKFDTIPVFLIKFSPSIKKSKRTAELKSTQDWLQIRLSDTLIRTLEYGENH